MVWKYILLRFAYVSPNNAQFISQTDAPNSMRSGQQATISVTMLNTGTTTWTIDNAYRLGSYGPQDNNFFNIQRVAPPYSVAPGQQATFTFTITAPNIPGGTATYPCYWRMVQDGVEWFGQFSISGVGINNE